MSTFSLLSPDAALYYYRASRQRSDHVRHPVRSRRLAPPHRRDRRQPARSADRARPRSSRRSRPQKAQRRRRPHQPGARGGDPAPPGRAPSRRASRPPRWCACGASCSRRRCGCRPVRGRRLRAAEAPGCWDLARDHYGSHDADAALSIDRPGDPRRDRGPRRGRRPADAAGGRAPIRGGAHLLSPRRRRAAGHRAPAVRRRAATPAATRRRAGDRPRRQQPTGDDRTLLVTESRGRHQPRRVSSTLCRQRARPARFLACAAHRRTGGQHLIEVDGFVPLDDPRLARFASSSARRLRRLVPLGGYAVPLPPTALVGPAPRKAEPNDAADAVRRRARASSTSRPMSAARPSRRASSGRSGSPRTKARSGPSPKAIAAYRALRRRDPPLSRRRRRRAARGARRGITGSTRRASSAAPAPTS